MLLVRLGDLYGLTDLLARGLAPVMGLVDLPAEAGLIWAITLLTRLYGGVGAFVSLQPEMQLTVAQVSVLSSLMLFAHALPVEQAITSCAAALQPYSPPRRCGSGRASPMRPRAAWICRTTGVLSEVDRAGVDAERCYDIRLGSWMRATAQSLVSMLAIIVALFLLLDILKAIKVIDWLTRALNPGLRLLGLSGSGATDHHRPAARPVLWRRADHSGNDGAPLRQARLFLALSCLSLCHSVIRGHGGHAGGRRGCLDHPRSAGSPATVLVIAVPARLLHRPGPRPALET
ncbi:MAG: hypothetical protein HPM95_01810 [Alphaproteobacteria bacterium]|nr:hypothetical protein [Alphaproteobacteria bacterium]